VVGGFCKRGGGGNMIGQAILEINRPSSLPPPWRGIFKSLARRLWGGFGAGAAAGLPPIWIQALPFRVTATFSLHTREPPLLHDDVFAPRAE